jgi:hypothetical protein
MPSHTRRTIWGVRKALHVARNGHRSQKYIPHLIHNSSPSISFHAQIPQASFRARPHAPLVAAAVAATASTASGNLAGPGLNVRATGTACFLVPGFPSLATQRPSNCALLTLPVSCGSMRRPEMLRRRGSTATSSSTSSSAAPRKRRRPPSGAWAWNVAWQSRRRRHHFQRQRQRQRLDPLKAWCPLLALVPNQRLRRGVGLGTGRWRRAASTP